MQEYGEYLFYQILALLQVKKDRQFAGHNRDLGIGAIQIEIRRKLCSLKSGYPANM